MPPLPCMCASFRRATRSLTQLYDQALRPTGLRATQFTVLQALSLTGEVTQGELGEVLAMDSTTLTRTLAIMVRRGWLVRRAGKDRRERRVRLAPAGHHQLKRGLVQWEKVQRRLRKQLGDTRWHSLFKITNQVAALTTQPASTKSVAHDQGGLS
ncbi:MAG TPA: MarR family winged helix-turn-helix transcriptional regulator [Candidatus Angelobacter sp.]